MKRKADFMMENVGGEYLLVPLGSQVMDINGIITLNDSGAYLWKLLEEEHTVDDLAAALAERFEVTPTQALTDVNVFLKQIGEVGMLE
ncbi:PqqD family protein [Candidatus Bipolaricaulota bacterium]|nr:PqqD family protein [Candidatus Bipolaricaulota bacterium]